MLENVTVIIPAHNRPDRLQRLLDYYAGTGVQLLVPDSSTDEFTGCIPCPDDTVYLHRPRMHFLLKLREVLPLIKTPYVLYCADDDFAVPEGIYEMTKFLDAHPDHSIAQGHYLTFTPHRDHIEFLPRYIRYFDKRVDGSTALERLSQEKSMYASLLYGVTRSDLFRKIYSYCFTPSGELRFRNLFLAEEFFNHAILICGNYATLPYFYSARERIEGSATDTTVPVSVIKTAPEYRDEYEGFIAALSLLLADEQPMPYEDASSVIRDLSAARRETLAVSMKRSVVMSLSRHRIFKPLARLSDRRYASKGLRAVAGMSSYPCTFSTPEKEAIVRAICRK